MTTALSLSFPGESVASAFANWLVLLTWLITQLGLLTGGYQTKSLQVLWLGILGTSEGLHDAVFTSSGVFGFFTCYEAVLIPLQILIAYWGSGIKRLRASMLFFVYTYVGSVPMLVSTLHLAAFAIVDTFLAASVVLVMEASWHEMIGLWVSFALSFAVKTPLFPFFIWLLFAHAEAPAEGSMILAGVVLKLATFGVLLILLGLLWLANQSCSEPGLLGSTYTLLMASASLLQQTDLKAFIALSSVAHMGNGTLGLLSQSEEGVAGALFMGLSHGLVSPSLFLIVGGALYGVFGTRLIYAYRGLLVLAPLTGSLLFVNLLANIAVPMSPNWIAELLILAGLARDTLPLCFFSSLNVLAGAVYTLWFSGRTLFGPWSVHLRGATDLAFGDFFALGILSALALALGLMANGSTQTLLLLSWSYL